MRENPTNDGDLSFLGTKLAGSLDDSHTTSYASDLDKLKGGESSKSSSTNTPPNPNPTLIDTYPEAEQWGQQPPQYIPRQESNDSFEGSSALISLPHVYKDSAEGEPP